MKAKLIFKKPILQNYRCEIKKNNETKLYSCIVSYVGERPIINKAKEVELQVTQNFPVNENDVIFLMEGNKEIAFGFIEINLGDK